MSTPQRRAAAAAAIGALTDFLLEAEAGTPRSAGPYLQQLVDEDGVGALAQGYYGLLDLSALLLAMAAEERGLEPRELLSRIALDAGQRRGGLSPCPAERAAAQDGACPYGRSARRRSDARSTVSSRSPAAVRRPRTGTGPSTPSSRLSTAPFGPRTVGGRG